MSDELAVNVFESGVVETNKGEIDFKFNENDPSAPKSLMKMNLRRPPKGKLTDKLITEISKEFVRLIRMKKIKFDLVVGLPRAGEPFAEKFVEIWNKRYPDKISIIYLDKEEAGGKRCIIGNIGGAFKRYQTVLLIDDVVSFGHSIVEAARALRKNGLVVKHCIVFMDWGFGKTEILKEKHAVRVISVYLAENLLYIWKRACLLPNTVVEKIIKRRDEIKVYGEEKIAI